MRVLGTHGIGKVLLLLLFLFVLVFLYSKCPNCVPGPLRLSEIWNRTSDTSRLNSLVTVTPIDNLGQADSGDDGRDPSTIYCNSPYATPTGEEGDSPDGFKLRMAHVFIRHGARTPFDPLPGYNHEDLDCNFRKWYPNHGHNEKFKRFSDSMDHSTEQKQVLKSFERYALYPGKDVCGLTSITSLGTLQLLNLGQFYYDSYINNKHLFGRNSSLASQTYARSTHREHTFQSTLAFLYGFLPTFNLSELIVTKSDNEFMCAPSEISCNCIKTQHLRGRFAKIALSAQSSKRALIKHLIKQTMLVINDTRNPLPKFKFPRLKNVIDYLLSLYCHSKDAPCSIRSPYDCIEYRNLENIWNVYIHSEKTILRDPERNFLKYSFLNIYPVLREMSNRIQAYIEGNSTQRLIIYVGHGKSIRSLLSIFGIYDGIWPPFASRFLIELYESTFHEGKHRFYLRFLYNGNDVTEDLFFCKESDFKTLCKFESFKYFMFSTLHKHFKTKDYGAVCRAKD